MKKVSIFIIAAVMAILLISPVGAANIDSAKNKFDMAGNVVSDMNVDGDYIAFGQTVKLESGVTGDIIAGGRTITITDENAIQNIFAAGQYISVRAKSVRNIYAAGSDIVINGGSDLKGAYLVGGTISFGGTAVDAYLAGASVTVDGTIYENLVIRSDHITFGKNATVNGHVTIYGTVRPQLSPNIPESKVTFKKIIQPGKENTVSSEQGISRVKVIMAIVSIVTAVFFALLMTLFRGGYFKARAAEFRKRAGKSVLYGLVALIVIPIGALVCMLTIFAIPVSLIVLTLYVVILYLSPVITGVILGRLLLPKINRYLSASLGAAAIRALLFVPYLNVALYLACAFYTLGITVMTLKPHREVES